MPRVTTMICNFQGEILYVYSDGLTLFSDNDFNRLHTFFSESSSAYLDQILNKTRSKQTVINSPLDIKNDNGSEEVFLSTLNWMNKIVIRISDQPLAEFFFDLTEQGQDFLPFVFPAIDAMDEQKLEEYSRLNSELTTIQRELQQRNVKLEELNQRLEILATTDAMTGLFNRRAIFERAEKELSRAKREQKYFGLALIDLDNLKTINDTYGHHMGDRALNSLAEILKSSTRGYDSAGRIGGDEFMLFFSLDSKDQFRSILNRLLENLRSVEIETEDQEIFNPRASIGGICYSAHEKEDLLVKDLLIHADQALYSSKDAGGNQITIKACQV